MTRAAIGIICTSPAWGGLEINTVRLSGWLLEKGWNIHLKTTEEAAILKNAGKSLSSISSFSKNPGKIRQLKELNHWVKEKGIKILFVPYNKDLSLAAAYKRYVNPRIRLVYQQHMMVGVPKRDIIHTRRYAMIDIWIAALQHLKEETLLRTRVPAKKIVLIPFGIETEKFTDSTISQGSARSLLQLPHDAFIIGILGRLDPKKGHDLVVEAVAELKAKGQTVHALLMGSKTVNEADDFVASLHHYIKTHSIEDLVHFKPYDPDVMQFFKAIDVFAMPSHGETFGMVTIEAMAAGVPVIGTDKFGTAEILGNGKFGWLFQPQDLTDFCRALSLVQSGEGVSAKVALAAEEAKTRYSSKDMVNRISALLETLV